MYHVIVWFFYTSLIFDPKIGTHTGDLGRLSYQVNMLHNRELKYTLPKKHLYKDNYTNQKVDILTIGDSFSNGGGGGENSYYQDFIASKFNKNVLNISPYRGSSSLETIVALYNNGYLKKLQPESIIIGSVERLIPSRYSKEIDFTANKAQAIPANRTADLIYPSVYIINTANYKLPYYSIRYALNYTKGIKAYKFSLKKDLFSANSDRNILIYYRDIKLLNQFTQTNIERVNDNFNKLAIMLKKINIKLYFMPSVDKYDLYYDYLDNNTYQKNPFFDLIRPLKKDYLFVDTKKILLPLLNKGEKDVYWIDDSHWTQKASKTIVNDDIFTQTIKTKRN